MKKFINSSIKIIITLIIISALCNSLYSWNQLDRIFGPKITYTQWVAIICIVQTIFPSSQLINSNLKKNDEQGS
jgi:hypothetical protein